MFRKKDGGSILKLIGPEVLSHEEILKIHESSLHILSNVGLTIKNDGALKLLDQAGAAVDYRTNLVKIPEHLIEEVMKWAPSTIDVYDRDRKSWLSLGGDNTYAWSGNDATYVLTSETGERRTATLKDVATFARLADALDNIDAVGVQGTPQDIRRGYAEVKAAEAMLNNTTKHLFFCPSDTAIAKAQLDLALAVPGGDDFTKRPTITFLVCPTTPLSWGKWAVETLMEGSRNGVPCIVNPCPTSGGTAPVTLAGTLVLQNAENISGVLISQLARRRSPVIYSCTSLALDMRDATALIATPETAALRIATTQLGKFYGFPTMVSGPDSQSHCLDEQNAWEKIMTAAVAISSGTNILINPGMFASGMTVSYEQLVIDNEILGWLHRFKKGIEISTETLAIQQIEKLGPGAQFLGTDLEFALRHLKTEYWTPMISCTSPYKKWGDKGAKTVVRVARERVEEIFRTHQPKQLDRETQAKLSRIVENFGK